jgi:hypothetical protein
MILFTDENFSRIPSGTDLNIMATEQRGILYRELIEAQLAEIDPLSAKRLCEILLDDHVGTWHYLHELCVGYSLKKKGFEPYYEQDVCGKSPDWLVTASTQNIIVEVVSLNPMKQILMGLDELDPDGDIVIHGEEKFPNEKRRPEDTIRGKAAKCKPFVDAGYPCILAVFSDCLNSISGRDAYHILVTGEDADGLFVKNDSGGLFKHDASRLSAVLWITGGIFPETETLIVNPEAPVPLPRDFILAFNAIK